MKSMKYKIGPFEKEKNFNKDTDQIVITKLKTVSPSNDGPTLHADYDADVDEINEIVIQCDVNQSSNSNVCIKSRQQLTKSNTSLSSTSSISGSASASASTSENINIPKDEEEEEANGNSLNSDTASSSESGFGTTADDENENGSNKEATLPSLNQCQPLPQEQRKQGFVQQQKSVDSNESTGSSNLPIIIHPPSRQIIFSGLANSSSKHNSDDVVNILNDNSSLNSSVSSAYSSSGGGGNRLYNCCSALVDSLVRFYYSCFCCYSTTSHTNQTPLIWSWISIFCCCCPLLGGVSLFLTHRSKKYKLKQKYALAEKYSNYAEKLNIASLIFGVIFYAIAFFLITLVIFMYWRPHNS